MESTAGAGAGLDLALLGRRERGERGRHGISLEGLSQRSGVSRSMISAAERGTKAATVLVLDRIATGLETSLARLLSSEVKSRVHVMRWREQSVAKGPSGWKRRILSPVLPGVEFEFMRTTLNPGADAGIFLPHAHGSREYVAVEKGTLNLTLDGTLCMLEVGDSIYYDGDCLHGFANSRQTACAYYLAMDVSGDPAGTRHRAVQIQAPGEPGGKQAAHDGSHRHRVEHNATSHAHDAQKAGGKNGKR
jgi:XRE family transcriptional regulator, regulator of sulfur utilization